MFDVAPTPNRLAFPLDRRRKVLATYAVPDRVPMAPEKGCNLVHVQEEGLDLNGFNAHGDLLRSTRKSNGAAVVSLARRKTIPIGALM